MDKRKSIIMLFAIMLLLSVVGCAATQSDDVAENNTDETKFRTVIDEYAEGGRRSWMIGIKFSDGTMLRRSGSGMDWTNVASSTDQLAILTDFISTIGAEAQLRHEAEANLND